MNQINILIIEDDPDWLIRLQQMLTQITTGPIRTASTLAQARQLLEQQLPDLVIADIVLPDGLSFELFMPKYRQLAVLFQTGYGKEDFLRKLLTMPNIGFLSKPFEVFALKAGINVLLSTLPTSPQFAPQGILVTGKHRQRITVPSEEIHWIKGEGNYSIIATVDQKYALKRSLRKVALELPDYFVQVQKGYLVNRNYIDGINQESVLINHQSIPLGRTYRKAVMESRAK